MSPAPRARALPVRPIWIAAGVLLAAVAVGHLGLGLSEAATGGAVSAIVALAAAAHLAAVAAGAGDGVAAALLAASAAGVLAFAGYPAVRAVLPGRARFEGELAAPGDRLPVPEGAEGPVRLLAKTTLPRSGTPAVRFRLSGGDAPVEGHLERTVSYGRVGRGARTAVTHDHASVWLETRLAPDAGALRLDVLQGEHDGPLRIAAFPDRLPTALAWGLAGVAALLAAAADARLRPGTSAGVIAAAAVAYGLLFSGNATPDAAAGTALGSVLVGLAAGAAGGGLATWALRRVLGGAAAARASA
jgi:hypothetical protein